MSVFTLEADIRRSEWHVRLVPTADMATRFEAKYGGAMVSLLGRHFDDDAVPRAAEGPGWGLDAADPRSGRVCSDRGVHRPFAGLEQVILVGRLVSDHHRVADDE